MTSWPEGLVLIGEYIDKDYEQRLLDLIDWQSSDDAAGNAAAWADNSSSWMLLYHVMPYTSTLLFVTDRSHHIP